MVAGLVIRNYGIGVMVYCLVIMHYSLGFAGCTLVIVGGGVWFRVLRAGFRVYGLVFRVWG